MHTLAICFPDYVLLPDILSLSPSLPPSLPEASFLSLALSLYLYLSPSLSRTFPPSLLPGAEVFAAAADVARIGQAEPARRPPPPARIRRFGPPGPARPGRAPDQTEQRAGRELRVFSASALETLASLSVCQLPLIPPRPPPHPPPPPIPSRSPHPKLRLPARLQQPRPPRLRTIPPSHVLFGRLSGDMASLGHEDPVVRRPPAVRVRRAAARAARRRRGRGGAHDDGLWYDWICV